jgi:DNA-directed RNA polymerase subunit RPC12/RpoP
MLFLAGEEVSEEKKLRCQKCNHEVQVPKGSSVPKCSKCGHDIFESSEPNGDGDD